MLTAQNISFVLPDGSALFANLNFTLTHKKYGLVGSNGVGKSTLAKILSSLENASEGKILRDIIPLYVHQIEVPQNESVGEYLSAAWENPLEDVVLFQGLIKDLDFSQAVSTLSGGQWMRLRLAKALALSPGFIILDEPTNNLDRSSRQRLYNFIENYGGGLLVISHDRELLEHMDQIMELSNQGLTSYGGAYSFYEEQKNIERARLSQELDTARREKKKQEREHKEKIEKQEKRTRWATENAEKMGLPRIIIGSRKRQAQVSLAKIHVNEQKRDSIAQEDFSQTLQRQKNSSHLRLEISTEKKLKGKNIFSLNDLNFRFLRESSFLWNPSLTLRLSAGERLVIRGENGAGKTTLLRLLTNAMPEGVGDIQGKLQKITRPFTFLSQDYRNLDLQENILENLSECSLDITELRNKLADFGFFGRDVFKTADVLSGGERLKLCLAKISLAAEPPEVLILDEPTNNLDLESLAILEEVLFNFAGTLIIVSHDEKFVERINCGRELILRYQKSE